MNTYVRRVATGFVALVLALTMGFGLAACGSSDENLIRAAITDMLEAFKNPTEENLAPYVKDLDQSTIDQMDEYGIDMYDMLGHLFKHFDYKINDVTVDGDKATANVSLTNADIGAAVQEMQNSLMQDEDFIAEFTELYGKDDKAAYKLIYDKLYESIDNAEDTVTTDIELKLSKTDGTWNIDDDSISDFVSAAYGGLDMSSLS